MRAVVMRRVGSPDVLSVEEVDIPVLSPGEVLIEVRAVSVNRTLDCAVRAGRYAVAPFLPHVLGCDPSGVIVGVGPGVTERHVGEHVVTSPVAGFTADGRACLLGVDRWGGYAEYVAVPAASTFVIPDGVDFANATVVARHAPLAFTQLRDHGRVEQGQWVLVMGAAGGLGSAGVQAARYLGARVIAAAGSPERVAAALALGAEYGIDYRSDDLAESVRTLTGGRGVDVVLENIGDPTLFPQALQSLSRGGRLVTAGAHGGGTIPLDVKLLYQNRLTIIGAPVETPVDYALALKAYAEGRFQVTIARRMSLTRAAEAHALIETGAVTGKIVLQPAA